jgi:hypothetical protein
MRGLRIVKTPQDSPISILGLVLKVRVNRLRDVDDPLLTVHAIPNLHPVSRCKVEPTRIGEV